MIGVVEQCLSLQSLEKGEVARTVSCMQVVADKHDALLPVQCLVHVEDDFELCQLAYFVLSVVPIPVWKPSSKYLKNEKIMYIQGEEER